MEKVVSQLVLFLISLRPKQWIKNFIVFVPLIFSGRFVHVSDIVSATIVFVLLSFCIGSTYILNDIKDRDFDAHHPKKCKRPIASGRLNIRFAQAFAWFVIFISLVLAHQFFGLSVTILFLVYLLNTILYTAFLKNQVIVDVFCIAIGFVLRGLIGAFAIGVIASNWLLIILFFGALLFGFLKRYQEVKLGISTRSNIAHYNEAFLKQVISMNVTSILIAYAFYTFNSTQSKHMVYTMPIVVFGIIRYYYNIFVIEKYDRSIEDIILKDAWMSGAMVIYVVIVGFIIYYWH